jgi:hypothetical protein
MARTPVLEKYIFDSHAGPRNCVDAPAGQDCKAELIFHDERSELFLCRTHAALRLSKNQQLMAIALVDLFLM